MKALYSIILLFAMTNLFAQGTIGEQMWSDTSKFKMMPDTNFVMMPKGYKMRYNKDLYLSSPDQQYILEAVRTKAKRANSSDERGTAMSQKMPWDDVYKCLTELLGNCSVTTRVRWSPLLCDKCQRHTIVFPFYSPMETWKRMCGRAGLMHLCPYCPRQVDFVCQYMN